MQTKLRENDWKIYLSLHYILKIFAGLFKQQELMKSSSPTEKMEVYIRQATADTYRQVLREIRQKEIYKLIIDTNPKHINKFFRTVILSIQTTNNNDEADDHI